MYTKVNATVEDRVRGRRVFRVLDVQEFTAEVHPEAVYQALLDQGIFAVLWCNRCERPHYSPRVLCPYCGSDSLQWRRSEGVGTVYSASTIAPRNGEPYVVVLVDLEDGPRVMSNVIGPATDVRIGMTVKVLIEARDDGAVPVFEAYQS
jgi:uncharacterized OB-fold protein